MANEVDFVNSPMPNTPRTTHRPANSTRLGDRVRQLRVSAGLTQTDQARSGSSYLSQSDPRLHFGLGNNRSPVDVEVRWPSAIVDRLRGVRPDQFLTVIEGQTAARRP